MGFFKKVYERLAKTRESISRKFFALFNSGVINDEFFDELEYALVSSDMGATVSANIIENLRETVLDKRIKTTEGIKTELKEILVGMLDYEIPDMEYPSVILVSGVNGAGKTTAIGKLAKRYKEAGKSVILAAADTFRAAASEQLTIWAERAGVRIVKHKEGADPAAVVYDALQSAKAKGADLVIVDTAGRLQNKKNLMEELKKITRVIEREAEGFSIYNYIVVDATVGQNAVSQVEVFDEAVELDGIILTKLDGTAKGGVVLAISGEREIPVLYVGIGEGIDDLIDFDAKDFVNAILE